MGWDWVIDTGKGLVAIFIVWLANILRKQAVPIYKWFKYWFELPKIVRGLQDATAIEKNKLHSLQNISKNPIYIINENGEMVYCNQAWIDATGFKDEREALGLGYLRAVHPDVRAEVSNQRVLIAQTDSAWNGAARFRHLKTGEDITYICVSETFKNNAGKIAGTIGTLYL